MNEPMLQRCLSCETEGSYPSGVTLCPVCGGSLEAVQVVADNNRVELLIPFAAAQCPACGMVMMLRQNRQCAGCGADLGDEARSQRDEAVRQRRRIFKVRIDRLTKRLDDSGLLQPTFTSEGQGRSLTDYIDTVFKPTLATVTALTDDVRTELRAVTWDAQDPTCICSFQRIVKALDQSITHIKSLAKQLPPIEVRAAHRILTRAAGQIIHGYVTITQALIAVDLDEALKRQQEGQQLFALGSRTLEPLSLVINRTSKQEKPGWWMSGDTLDLAAIAWEGVENVPVTIDQAADRVRTALAMIPGVTELSDAEALLLLPATVLPVTIADPVLLQERAGLIRDMLTKADSTTPGWIQDQAGLVQRISEGIQAVNEQVERVGFAETGPHSRKILMQLLADVYLKLVEGPLCDLGCVVVIAARAAGGEPNGMYIPKIALKAGDTIQALERMGPLWSHTVRVLVRNASAHAGVRVLDDGIALTQCRIENEVVTDEKTVKMNDAEFTEELARLSETCLALQLGIIPWLFTHPSEDIMIARQAIAPTQRECEGTVRLLAGLQGLLNVTVERDGNILIVQALASHGTDAYSMHITSLVPAIFHSWTDIDTVTLHISSRNPVTYERAELPDRYPLSDSRNLAAIGLMGRRWLDDLSGEAAIAADITYLVRPQIATVREAIKYANTPPTCVANIVEAYTRLVSLTNRLRHVQLASPSTRLVTEVREIARDGVRRLDRLRWAFRGADIRERQRQTRSCAALVNQLDDIERRANDEFTRVEAAEKVQ